VLLSLLRIKMHVDAATSIEAPVGKEMTFTKILEQIDNVAEEEVLSLGFGGLFNRRG
jgi:hypothetical protein